MEIIILLLVLAMPVYLVYLMIKCHKSKKEIDSLNSKLKRGYNEFEEFREESENKEKEHQAYKHKMDHLQQYSVIVDAESEASHILKEANNIKNKSQIEYDKIIDEANELASQNLSESRAKAKLFREKAEAKLTEANHVASNIELMARKRAEDIAGSAWEAKENAEQYEATVKAMKNIIKGYGDEYLIPNTSLLDELAEEYDHKEAGKDLAKIRTLIKSMIKNDETANCDYVEAYRKTTAKDFVLDAFNGKIDTIMSKVKHNNYGKLKQQVEDAYRLVNHNGKAFRNARITPRYFETMKEQLDLAVKVHELKLIDREEQREIKQQIREEARALREYEKARKEAEREEKMLQKAMAEARKQLESANAEQRLEFELKLKDLEQQLVEADEKNQRAISMAQQTRQGHVYVISNVGSFGENIYKIGMTRRLEPLDRVKELGDASVPFSFDVHAMIHSKDAPALEKTLHAKFKLNQVNKINARKEFFSVDISDVKSVVDTMNIETHWTLKSEAREYKESLAMAKEAKLAMETA